MESNVGMSFVRKPPMAGVPLVSLFKESSPKKAATPIFLLAYQTRGLSARAQLLSQAWLRQTQHRHLEDPGLAVGSVVP